MVGSKNSISYRGKCFHLQGLANTRQIFQLIIKAVNRSMLVCCNQNAFIWYLEMLNQIANMFLQNSAFATTGWSLNKVIAV